jgi:hypothetical protein
MIVGRSRRISPPLTHDHEKRPTAATRNTRQRREIPDIRGKSGPHILSSDHGSSLAQKASALQLLYRSGRVGAGSGSAADLAGGIHFRLGPRDRGRRRDSHLSRDRQPAGGRPRRRPGVRGRHRRAQHHHRLALPLPRPGLAAPPPGSRRAPARASPRTRQAPALSLSCREQQSVTAICRYPPSGARFARRPTEKNRPCRASPSPASASRPALANGNDQGSCGMRSSKGGSSSRTASAPSASMASRMTR